MTDREDILAKIRRLRELTTKRGCTEAEAIAAAQKAAQLMAQYGLDDDDVEMLSAQVKTKVPAGSPRSKISAYIAVATNTSMLFRDRDEIIVYGLAPGPDIAVYLQALCERAIAREIRTFKQGSFYKRRRSPSTRRQAVDEFVEGMSRHLGHRLLEMFSGSLSEERRERAENYRNERHASAQPVKRKAATNRYYEAGVAGHRAGGNVELNHGVNGGGTAPLRIGGSHASSD